jgi:hypothetical protein
MSDTYDKLSEFHDREDERHYLILFVRELEGFELEEAARTIKPSKVLTDRNGRVTFLIVPDCGWKATGQ